MNTNLNNLPPPPQGKTGITLDQFKHLPPPPKGQQGFTLEQIQSQSNNQITPAEKRNIEVGGNTALLPTKPAPETNTGFADTLKMIPNALGDVGNLIKEATYGTAKKLVYDIPKEAYNLFKEQGANAIPNLIASVPEATVKTAWGLVPQSLKEVANTNALADIPHIFSQLAKEKGGYANAFLDAVKSIPDSLSPALTQYADQIDKARQSFENHPVNELLGYLGLKQLATNPKGTAESVKQGFGSTKELITNPVASLKDIKNQAGQIISPIVNKITPESGSIMNRVARLTPTDATKFEKLSGMSHGDYLANSGNFGAPDTIIKNESIKFVNSLNSVDTAMAKLPGVYESAPLKTMADELVARENRVSSKGAPSPDLAKATELKNKLDSGGITMFETNELKRIYERNVKLDFQRQNLPEQTARASNIDSAVRSWQFKTAGELGLENLPELNKQTQISKFIIDKLGKQLVGKTGNDAMNLTDWIILAGHSPESVGAFLTKKFFSSKTVQAKIASIISKEPTINPIKAQSSVTPENINRQINPQGMKALPAGTNPTIQNKVPINVGGKSTMESRAGKVFNQENMRFQNQLPPPSGERLTINPNAIKVAPRGKNIEITSKKGIIPSKRK
jgi:hypothetical protein